MTNGEEEQHRKIENTDGRDTTYGSDFALRMNQIDETKWKRYNLIFGSLLGLLMGAVLFLLPDSLVAESARLVVVFVIAALPMRFFEQRAERSIRHAKICMAVCFLACMIGYAVFLLVK